MLTQSNKLDFNGQSIYVGIDVHLKSWKVTILMASLTHKTFSQDPSPKLLHQYLTRNFPGGQYYSAYEAGFCGYWIHNELNKLGIKSMVVNPADIPTTNKEKVQKDDKRDSRKIAKSLCNGDLTPIYVSTTKTLEDRGLLRARATLIKDLTRYKNRIKSFLYFHRIAYPVMFQKSGTHWTNRFILWLKELNLVESSASQTLLAFITQSVNLRSAILDITRAIRALSKSKPYKKKVDLLMSIPGVGMLSAMTFLTEIETINRFETFDKLCGFIGLIPSTNSSGEKEISGKITSRGHSILRSTLIECAWVTARLDPNMLRCYHDYCKRMEPNKAIIRIARKLLNRIRFVLTNNQPYVLSVVK